MTTSKLAKTKTTVQMVFLYLGLIIGVFKDASFFLGEWIALILSTNTMFLLLLAVTLFTVYSGVEYLLNNKRLFQSER